MVVAIHRHSRQHGHHEPDARARGGERIVGHRSLRTITSGRLSIPPSCGRGNFATILTTLAASSAGFSRAVLPPDLTAAAIIQKSGFRIQMVTVESGRPSAR